eukprot:1160777-Pelagomonas_calceolata.AAC.13
MKALSHSAARARTHTHTRVYTEADMCMLVRGFHTGSPCLTITCRRSLFTPNLRSTYANQNCRLTLGSMLAATGHSAQVTLHSSGLIHMDTKPLAGLNRWQYACSGCNSWHHACSHRSLCTTVASSTWTPSLCLVSTMGNMHVLTPTIACSGCHSVAACMLPQVTLHNSGLVDMDTKP